MKNRWIILTLTIIFSLICLAGCTQSSTEEDLDVNTTESMASSTENDSDIEDKEESGDTDSLLASPSVNGKLHVNGTQLVDEKGNQVQLRGISSHGLAWFPEYINEKCFSDLHSWGANVIRLAVYTAESGGYCTDGDKDTLKSLVEKGVEYATNEDMYVIIDWHILSEGSPAVYQTEAEEFFDEMSKKFSANNNVLYEICNEPNGNAEWNTIKDYAEDIIPIIRANDPYALIIVGTPSWSKDVDKAAENPISEYDNIMYTLHFYAATHKDELRSVVKEVYEDGLPIFVTEFGICDSSGNGSIDEDSANTWISLLDQYNISYVMWNLSNKDETSAIISSNVTKTSGFTESDLSDSGKWLYNMLQLHFEDESHSDLNTSSESENSSSKSEDIPSENTVVSNGMTVTYSLTDSWQTDGDSYYMYNATVKNTSGAAVDSWKINLTFDGNVTFSDGWNGTFSTKNKTLTISSVDYNGKLATGESAENIGFIVIY